jgi:hypothetical protein
MTSPIGQNEIRVVIRPVEARDYDLGPVQKDVRRVFDGAAGDGPRTTA